MHPPAVDHHGPSVWRIAGLYPSKKGQDGCGILRNPVVGPGHELELSDLPLLTGAILQKYQVSQLSIQLVHVRQPFCLQRKVSYCFDEKEMKLYS